MKRESAKAVLDNVIRASELLGECRLLIEQGNSDREQVKELKTNLAIVLGDVFDKLLAPILREHPDLTPPRLK